MKDKNSKLNQLINERIARYLQYTIVKASIISSIYVWNQRLIHIYVDNYLILILYTLYSMQLIIKRFKSQVWCLMIDVLWLFTIHTVTEFVDYKYVWCMS